MIQQNDSETLKQQGWAKIKALTTDEVILQRGTDVAELTQADGTTVYVYRYPHPAVTVDNVIFGFDGLQLKVLLIKRGIEPYKNRWAFPGGFINPDETTDEAARRELREETTLDATFSEQFRVFSEPHRDTRERVITVAYVALCKIQEVKGCDDAKEAQWFALEDVPQLAFDHDAILRQALQTLRERICFQPIGFELLDEKFTMKQLQTLYEAVLGIRFDRANFAKKMLKLNILNQLDEVVWPTKKHSATLYTFNKENYDEMKRKGIRMEF